MNTARWAVVFFAVLILVATGCAQHSSSDSTNDDGGGSGGGGAVGPGTFRFEPGTAYASPGDTINFQLLDGTAPYQFGYVDPSDIQSYSDASQIQATFDTNTGAGSYTVGPNTDCTDRLAAADADDNIVYLTITVGQSGDGGGGGGGSGAGIDPSNGSGGTIAPGEVATWSGYYVYIPTSYNPSAFASPVIFLFNEDISEWDDIADANGIILVDLNEYNNESLLMSRIQDAYPKLEAQYNVDRARYYCAGFSAGGNIAIIFTDNNQSFFVAAMSFPGSYQPAPSIPSSRPAGAKYYYAVGSYDTAYYNAIPKAAADRQAQGYTVRYDVVQGCGHYISESQYHKREDAWNWVKGFNLTN